MIKGILFFLGLIWIFVAFYSLAFGSMYGLNRRRLSAELKDFISFSPSSTVLRVFRVVAFWIGYIGFLFPMCRPILSLLGAISLFGFVYIISRG